MIKPAMIFGDNMILQRQKPIRIWGSCTDEVIIRGRLGGTELTAKIKDQNWEIVFPQMETCEDIMLEIWSDMEHLTFHNIAVGEVWIAAGQSNMEFYLRYDEGRSEAPGNSRVRMFDCPKTAYSGQLKEYDYSEFGFWRMCDERNLDYFSAVAYYFAMSLEKKYHIPIGIIGCTWGGTPACTWMDAKYLEDTPGRVWLDEYQETAANLNMEEYNARYKQTPNYRGRPFEDPVMEKMMYGMPDEEWGAFLRKMSVSVGEEVPLPIGPKSEQRPGGLYENMVRKIAPYTIRGVIWYQGENDEGKAGIYHTVFSKLIQCWRDLWKESFPFLFVQLAPFGYWGSPEIYPMLRRAQQWVSKQVPDTWMASVMDIGNKFDIHPKKKRPVGERLALLARGHVYGEEILCDAPEYAGAELAEGKITVYFHHTGDELILEGNNINALEVLADGRVPEQLKLNVTGSTLIIRSPAIHTNSCIKIAFAEMGFCKVNLYNQARLPVKPFTAKINMDQGGRSSCCRQ